MAQQRKTLCYHSNCCVFPRFSLSIAALNCRALDPGNTMTSLPPCIRVGILRMHRRGLGANSTQPRHASAEVFLSLFWFIPCNPFLRSLLSLCVFLSLFLALSKPHFPYLFSISTSPQRCLPVISVLLLPSLKLSYQAVCQIIRWDIYLKVQNGSKKEEI